MFSEWTFDADFLSAFYYLTAINCTVVAVLWVAFVGFVYFNSWKIKACSIVFARISYFNFAIFMSATHNPSRLLHIFLVPSRPFLCWFAQRELRITKIWSTSELSSSKKANNKKKKARYTYILCDVEKVLCSS